MRRHSIITEDNVLKAIRLLRWVKRRELMLYFEGKEKRTKALERLLPALEKEERVTVSWHRGEKVYSMPRKKWARPVSMDHELACADILIRLWRCRMGESEIFTERAFRGFGIVPEGGLRYSEARGSMLIFEYSTRSNFLHGGVLRSKLTRYKKYLPEMEAKVGRFLTVLFILDVERVKVKEFIARAEKLLKEPVFSGTTGELRFPFLFTDYRTFRSVPVGEALKAKIYIWHDGSEWRLSENDQIFD